MNLREMIKEFKKATGVKNLNIENYVKNQIKHGFSVEDFDYAEEAEAFTKFVKADNKFDKYAVAVRLMVAKELGLPIKGVIPVEGIISGNVEVVIGPQKITFTKSKVEEFYKFKSFKNIAKYLIEQESDFSDPSVFFGCGEANLAEEVGKLVDEKG